MKRFTLKTVNKAIQQKWPHVELVQGKDYFYIAGLNDEWGLKIAALYQQGIYVANLNQQPVERWVKDVELLLLDKHQLNELERNPIIDEPALTDSEFYEQAAKYLSEVYSLPPIELNLSVESVKNRGKDETPIEYIDHYAEKYDLNKLENCTLELAITVLKEFKN